MRSTNLLSRTILVIVGLVVASQSQPPLPAWGTVFDWDNFTGNSNFSDAANWLPGGGPPGAADTALFDGQLLGSGIGNHTVNVANGTAINDLQLVNSPGFPTTTVDLTIGDGTSASRFDLDDLFGDSLVIGGGVGGTATLTLLGGRLDTLTSRVRGSASLNIVNAGALWDSTDVVVAGDGLNDLPGVGVGQNARVATHGNLSVGNDAGSGRLVVDGGGLGTPALWSVDQSVTIGAPTVGATADGILTVRNGGRVTVGQSVSIHPGFDEVRQSALTVTSGGEVDVTGSINVLGELTRIDLNDMTSTITAGDIDIDEDALLDWTGGTIHITNGRLRIDDSPFADWGMDSLAVSAGKTLKVSRVTPSFDSLTVGNIGTGSLGVTGGGVVESYNGYVGEAVASDGEVTVTGTDSRWIVTEDLVIGFKDNAVGKVNVAADGYVEANSILLGTQDAADGTIDVDGGELRSNSVLAIGGVISDDGISNPSAGASGHVTVQNGGVIDVEKTLIVFGGGTLNLESGGALIADELRLEPGGTFSQAGNLLLAINRLTGFGPNPNFAGNVWFGHEGGSASGGHSVSAGESLTAGLTLGVGITAPASFQVVDGTVSSGLTIFGGTAAANGSSALLSGSLANWTADSFLIGGDSFGPGGEASLVISGGAEAIAALNTTVWDDSDLVLDNGTLNTPMLNVFGRLVGDGTININVAADSVVNLGTIEPGISIGTLEIVANVAFGNAYLQTSAGTLRIDIGGSAPDEYDRLQIVNGGASLDGMLEVNLVPLTQGGTAFVPQAGDSFEILHATDGLGGTTFATLPADLPALTGALFWDIIYENDFVRLNVLTPFSADFDRDGDVDKDDLAVWRGAYGSGAGADADFDGDSDGHDLLAWQRQYTGNLAPLAMSVPEPAGLSSLGLCVLLVAWQSESRYLR